MAYHILICDDEWIVREGIARILSEFSELEVLTAQSGAQALELMQKGRIDGLILDIRMPVMDGIEVLRQAQARLGETPVTFILSGYDEFEYARQVMHYGVTDYILKPATPDKVREIARSLLALLGKKQRFQEELDRLRSQFDTIKPLIKERFFFDLLDKTIRQERMQSVKEFLGINRTAPYFQVALLSADSDEASLSEEAHQIRLYAVGQQLERGAEALEDCCFFHVSTGVFALLFSFSAAGGYPGLQDRLEELISGCPEDCQVAVNAGIGGVVTGLEYLRYSYSQALQALYSNHFGTTGAIVSIEDIQEQELLPYRRGKDDVSGKLRMGDMAEAEASLERLFQEILEQGAGIGLDAAILFCSQAIVSALGVLEESGGGLRDFYGQFGSCPIPAVAAHKTLPELFRYTRHCIGAIRQYMEQNAEKKNRSIVERGRQLILSSYRRELGVAEIAEQLSLSKNYFGQLFKSQTGMTVSEYLNLVRIEKAKALLKETTLKVYEIADEVGFTDSFYFSSVFKKLVGVSPKEYREMQ